MSVELEPWQYPERLEEVRERRREIIELLSKDQCRQGFDHTADTIIYWLDGCTDDALEILQSKIKEHVREKAETQERADRKLNLCQTPH